MRRTTLILLCCCLPTLAAAADLAGSAFHDRNANGVRDPGEEGVVATLEVFGLTDTSAGVDLNVVTATDGSFAIGSIDIADGCYATRLAPPAGFRLGLPRNDCPAMDLGPPVGTRRYGAPRHLIDRLRMGSLVHVGLGDSIAEPASVCTLFPQDNTDYLKWLRQRLECIAPTVAHHNEAIGGEESNDLLRPAGTCGWPLVQDPLRLNGMRCNNIYDAIARNPDLVTISIGGNDWLGSEPATQTEPFVPAQVQTSVEALLSARANVQEILATLASELPTTDVIVSTVHDNRAASCASSDFHNIWAPIWMQMLRDVVWGQGDRFQIAEISPEYAHQDLNGGNCCGAQGRVCSDGIHPTRAGAQINLEKVWDAAGGINLGPRDGIGATSNPDVHFPLIEQVAVRLPTVAEDRQANVIDADWALVEDDRGALVPAGAAELVLSGFDATPDDIIPTRVVIAVRYRTVGLAPTVDPVDGHYFEADVAGLFGAPSFTVTGWNSAVPIVGTGSSAAAPNALVDVPTWREARATLTRNLLDDGRADGFYTFAPVTWSDIASLAVRLRGVTRGGVDPRTIEWDAAWIEVYGTRTTSSAYDVYRATEALDLVQPINQVGSAIGTSYDDVPPIDPVLYYAVDDGMSRPGEILMIKSGGGAVRIEW